MRHALAPLALLLAACAADPGPGSTFPTSESQEAHERAHAGDVEQAHGMWAADSAPASPSPGARADASPGAVADAGVSEGQASPGAARDERAEAYEWASAHCQLEQPPQVTSVKCEPVCVKRTSVPCPEFRCSVAPPRAEWVALASNAACQASRGTVGRDAKLSRYSE